MSKQADAVTDNRGVMGPKQMRHILRMRELEAARFVTDAESTDIAPTVTDAESLLNYTFASRNISCEGCNRKLSDGETVWRFRGSMRGACCRIEREHTPWSYGYLPEKPCEICGRGVVNLDGARRRIHVLCLNECSAEFYRRLTAERRLASREAAACQTCNQPFTPKRSDAKHCSSKCKQIAYRQRHSEKAEQETVTTIAERMAAGG
jgi:hypothetical protein